MSFAFSATQRVGSTKCRGIFRIQQLAVVEVVGRFNQAGPTFRNSEADGGTDGVTIEAGVPDICLCPLTGAGPCRPQSSSGNDLVRYPGTDHQNVNVIPNLKPSAVIGVSDPKGQY